MNVLFSDDFIKYFEIMFNFRCLNSIHYTLYSKHYAVHTIHYTLYTIHYTVYPIHYIVQLLRHLYLDTTRPSN